ncbi:ABC transporter ATP-binding protein [Streptomyces parvulus]|uniref:ABC transporter ATP-binding protein n=1 Tax=Streptomyces parvulus TaxID=146923 RepID=UPI0033A97688
MSTSSETETGAGTGTGTGTDTEAGTPTGAETGAETAPGTKSASRTPAPPRGTRLALRDATLGRPGASASRTPAPPRGTRLALRDATLGRPGAVALTGVDVDVSPGEILAVVGPSGCGKSTLLRTLAGLLAPLSGAAEQDGHPITGPGADRALVFQEDALLPWRTLRGNVELPLAIQGRPRAERRERATAWLDRVGLTAQARQLPHRVSGGQRQRAQLARALAGRPRAVLMDEPFGALDAQTRAGMQDLLVEALHGTGATVVFVTHDVDEALFLGDRVALLGAGRLTAVREVPRPRERAAHDDPARTALRHDVLTSLGT